MNRPTLSIQERALRALVRTGEVELKTVRYEAIDNKGNIVQCEKKIYKTRDDCRYNLLNQPREEPRFRSCSPEISSAATREPMPPSGKSTRYSPANDSQAAHTQRHQKIFFISPPCCARTSDRQMPHPLEARQRQRRQ